MKQKKPATWGRCRYKLILTIMENLIPLIYLVYIEISFTFYSKLFRNKKKPTIWRAFLDA